MTVSPSGAGSSQAQLLGGGLPLASCFLFEVKGVEVGVFAEVSGLSVTIETSDIVEGGQNSFVYKMPGRMTWPNITLKRGVTDGNALFEWMESTSGEGYAKANSKITRRSGAITAIDDVGTRLRAWELIDVMPVRWKGPDFSVNNGAPLEEELEITHHGFRAVKPAKKA